MADLSSCVCVDRILFLNNNCRFSLSSGVNSLAVTEDCDDLGILFCGMGIAGEYGCRCVDLDTAFSTGRACLIVIVISCTVPLFLN